MFIPYKNDPEAVTWSLVLEKMQTGKTGGNFSAQLIVFWLQVYKEHTDMRVQAKCVNKLQKKAQCKTSCFRKLHLHLPGCPSVISRGSFLD